jgi:hypothetical protein
VLEFAGNVLQKETTTMKTENEAAAEPGSLQRLVRRVSVKMFDDYNWTLIPTVIVGHEPAAWGYPSGRWAAFVWLKWNLQIALHDRPREGCILWAAASITPTNTDHAQNS